MKRRPPPALRYWIEREISFRPPRRGASGAERNADGLRRDRNRGVDYFHSRCARERARERSHTSAERTCVPAPTPGVDDVPTRSFCDLVLAGLLGVRPAPDGRLRVAPLLEGDFAVDRLRIRGCEVAVVADRTGRRYARGCAGLCVYVDGALAASVAASATSPASLTVQLACRDFR